MIDRGPDPSPVPQDQHGILVTAKFTSDATLASKMIEFNDIFTFNADGSLILAQDRWNPYLAALTEGKPPPEPPPDSARHAKTKW